MIITPQKQVLAVLASQRHKQMAERNAVRAVLEYTSSEQCCFFPPDLRQRVAWYAELETEDPFVAEMAALTARRRRGNQAAVLQLLKALSDSGRELPTFQQLQPALDALEQALRDERSGMSAQEVQWCTELATYLTADSTNLFDLPTQEHVVEVSFSNVRSLLRAGRHDYRQCKLYCTLLDAEGYVYKSMADLATDVRRRRAKEEERAVETALAFLLSPECRLRATMEQRPIGIADVEALMRDSKVGLFIAVLLKRIADSEAEVVSLPDALKREYTKLGDDDNTRCVRRLKENTVPGMVKPVARRRSKSEPDVARPRARSDPTAADIEDIHKLAAYLSSPTCCLFRHAEHPLRLQGRVLGSILLLGGGGVLEALRMLMALNCTWATFKSGEELAEAVKALQESEKLQAQQLVARVNSQNCELVRSSSGVAEQLSDEVALDLVRDFSRLYLPGSRTALGYIFQLDKENVSCGSVQELHDKVLTQAQADWRQDQHELAVLLNGQAKQLLFVEGASVEHHFAEDLEALLRAGKGLHQTLQLCQELLRLRLRFRAVHDLVLALRVALEQGLHAVQSTATPDAQVELVFPLNNRLAQMRALVVYLTERSSLFSSADFDIPITKEALGELMDAAVKGTPQETGDDPGSGTPAHTLVALLMQLDQAGLRVRTVLELLPAVVEARPQWQLHQREFLQWAHTKEVSDTFGGLDQLTQSDVDRIFVEGGAGSPQTFEWLYSLFHACRCSPTVLDGLHLQDKPHIACPVHRVLFYSSRTKTQ